MSIIVRDSLLNNSAEMCSLSRSRSTWILLLFCFGNPLCFTQSRSSVDAEPLAAGVIIGIALLVTVVAAVYLHTIPLVMQG